MLKKIIYFSLAVIIFSACSTSKKSTKTVKKTIPAPTGIEFTKVKNYNSFALINMPYSGKGFTKNQDVDIDRNRNDADDFVPGVKYEGCYFVKWSTIRGAEGDLDAQFVAMKKKLLQSQIKDNSEIVFEKKTIGKYETALVKISTPVGSKGTAAKYAYGYLIAHDNKAALFMVEDVVMPTSELETFTQPLEEAMQYMIKTVEFK
jgi:hypothetical protein